MYKIIRGVVLLYLFTYILSQQNATLPSFNFSSLPSNLTIATSCGVASPKNSTDCTQQNSMLSYCCYLTRPLGASICQPISPLSYQTSITSWNLNGTNYSIKCDIKEGSTGSPCGVVGPNTYTDCTKYSTSSNSCCYYKNSTLGANYCFWMGSYFPYSPIPAVQCTPPVTANSTSTTSSQTYIYNTSYFVLTLFLMFLAL